MANIKSLLPFIQQKEVKLLMKKKLKQFSLVLIKLLTLFLKNTKPLKIRVPKIML